MTQEEEKEYGEAMSDFAKIDEIENKVISLRESMGILRELKDKQDATFSQMESIIDLKISRLTHEKKGLQDGSRNL